ncbi:MAG: hypothetical protein RLZ05_1361 [Bacteroidota bacterium]|jgi:hypothetical protein
MISPIRSQFNQAFSEARYQAMIEDIENKFPGDLDFRIAETPLFVPARFTDQMKAACDYILAEINEPAFKKNTNAAIPSNVNFGGSEGNPVFIVFDFAVCKTRQGEWEPQLIEMQGFPSLFAYQVLLDDQFRIFNSIPPGFSTYLSGYDKEAYLNELNKLLLNNYLPEEVILLDIFPKKQKTRIDFTCTKNFTGIEPICLTEIIREGNQLFYKKEKRLIRIKRIFNRLIPDDLYNYPPAIQRELQKLEGELEVEWCIHPNWFYRISKYTLPFLHHPTIPSSYFLNEVTQLPANLSEYVLKPLFSFGGQGVLLDFTYEDVENIENSQEWILQKKVNYANVIETPDGPAKAEIRLFYWWPSTAEKPIPVNSLCRLSKGEMIGTRYNKNKTWVGSTCCYFEPNKL